MLTAFVIEKFEGYYQAFDKLYDNYLLKYKHKEYRSNDPDDYEAGSMLFDMKYLHLIPYRIACPKVYADDYERFENPCRQEKYFLFTEEADKNFSELIATITRERVERERRNFFNKQKVKLAEVHQYVDCLKFKNKNLTEQVKSMQRLTFCAILISILLELGHFIY